MPDPRSLFDGMRVTVMGLGLLGRGLGDTLFLIKAGARVTVTDLKTAEQLAPSVKQLEGLPVSLRLGSHNPDDFVNADMVLRNADVPRSSPFLKLAAEHGVPVEMDESLFCKHFNGRVVGITGTRGKTTTTTLSYRILLANHQEVFLGGNIMGRSTLPLLAQAATDATVVLELSSWQLQGFHDAHISPYASVFTNIYPDHLNRYTGMAEYISDKKAIFSYQDGHDFCIFNRDQKETADLAREAPAQSYFFSRHDVPPEWTIRIPGQHNRENVAAALELTSRLGVPPEVIRAGVEGFEGVEHRLQWLGEKHGIGFVNDGTSTTPVAGCAALEALDGKRILLIAGGADKKLDLTPFAETASRKAQRIALLRGEATGTLRQAIADAGGAATVIGVFDDLESAVRALMAGAAHGDVVLLSPGCASFGMFLNEFHRGQTFIDIFHRL